MDRGSGYGSMRFVAYTRRSQDFGTWLDICRWRYMHAIHGKQEGNMTLQTARVGKNNRAQVVTIPLEFRFPEGMKEVYIR